MRKAKGWLIIIVLVALSLSGCQKVESGKGDSGEQMDDKIHIGMSFDSFVIERWQRDRDVFVSTA